MMSAMTSHLVLDSLLFIAYVTPKAYHDNIRSLILTGHNRIVNGCRSTSLIGKSKLPPAGKLLYKIALATQI